MNPLKSYVAHALQDADPEPDIDRPRLRANQTPGGQIQLYGPDTSAWIGCEAEDCIVPEEVA